MSDRTPLSRGMAMLFVLATLVVSVTATALIARSRTTSRLSTLSSSRTASCDGLRAASEAPIREWLGAISTVVALPPEADPPQVTVLHDRWTAGGETWRLQITAWDLCGMVPFRAVLREHPLSSALPPEVVDRVRATEIPEGAQPGLDLFRVGRASPFPSTQQDAAVSFGPADLANADSSDPVSSIDPMAIGGWVATHSPGQSGRTGRSAIWLNVNTAPMPLVRRAFELAGISGVEIIEQKRAEGEPATLNIRASSREAGDEAQIKLVTVSKVWAFRIDTQVGGVRRSWWEVWTQGNGNWEVAQRLAISN